MFRTEIVPQRAMSYVWPKQTAFASALNTHSHRRTKKHLTRKHPA